MKNSTTKKIFAITTITTLGTIGLASAQSTTTQDHIDTFGEKFSKMVKKTFGKNNTERKGNHEQGRPKNFQNASSSRAAVENAIIAGNFANFQIIASTTPMATITEATFNSLVPQFTALKNAREAIKTILKTAGIQAPDERMFGQDGGPGRSDFGRNGGNGDRGRGHDKQEKQNNSDR